MILLQSHNQVLFHLTQLTSAVTPRRTGLAVRAKSAAKHNNEKDILCYGSLIEAASNCTEFRLEKINLQNLRTALQVKKVEVLEILKQISCGATPRFQSSNNKWRISYVSGDSFAENKRMGLNRRQNSEQFRLLQNLCSVTQFRGGIITRGFKTERNVKAELQRNPSFGGRLRQWMGLSPPVHQIAKLQMSGSGTKAPQVEKLQSLLNEGEITAAEQQRVKVAFAEGYLAGHKQNYPVHTRKWYKVILQIVMFATLLGILTSISNMYKSSANGSLFRLRGGEPAEVDPEDIDVTFNDVKGADEAKQELKEIVEFLKNPDKFSVLGGKLPKGVILVGPPGTGKTLLARAVAGEAKVPFFHAAGPEFDEILVGQGAKRVRELFRAAKERAPCVIFIDEIDSVGAKRTNSLLHPYANQTINQLLSEMDGFHRNEGVIVLGATNRREDLDTALLRPGRFDVEVSVPKPDFTGRKEILELYLGRVLSRDIDVDILSRETIGFTGADLENMVNQAALRAAIDGDDFVSMKHLDHAKDKMLMGPERKGLLDKETNLITAYHEGGHAIVAYFTKDSHPLHKVTILPRSKSLGHTAYIPEKEVYHMTKQRSLAMMDIMMGGRAAEELVFGPDKITSGASNDLEKATGIAVAMVKQWGMSEKVGLRTLSKGINGYSAGEVSPNSQELIDSEVKRLMQESYERAKAILKAHSTEHKQLAEALVKYETLNAEDVKAIMTGQSSHKEPVKKATTEVPKNVM